MANKTSGAIRFTLTRIALPLTMAGIVIAAILLRPMKERTPMNPSRTPSEADTTIPPIDLNGPTETKIATFALG